MGVLYSERTNLLHKNWMGATRAKYHSHRMELKVCHALYDNHESIFLGYKKKKVSDWDISRDAWKQPSCSEWIWCLIWVSIFWESCGELAKDFRMICPQERQMKELWFLVLEKKGQGDYMIAVFKYGKYSCKGEDRCCLLCSLYRQNKEQWVLTSVKGIQIKERFSKPFSMVRMNPTFSSGWPADNVVCYNPRAETWKSLISVSGTYSY